jgi:hypothetical protein
MIPVLVLLGVLAAAVAMAFLALAVRGKSVPESHTALTTVRIRKSQREVWETVRDIAAWHTWAPGVRSVDVDRSGARERFVLKMNRHAMPLVVEREETLRRFVTVIDDVSLPFGGRWTWTFATEGAGCRVTLHEEGVIRKPVLRALAHYVVGYHAPQKAFLKALAEKLGDGDSRPERAD